MSRNGGILVAVIKHCDFDTWRWRSLLVEGKIKSRERNMVQAEKGGLEGGDLSGLDCVLIEVTCIKWNLIGTDTGSLTDRHDADGLGGGGQGGR